jgi:dTDP-4-amino-4,6-dideoxygalactose transaminase
MDWLQALCVKSKHKHAYHEDTIKVLAERRAVIQETMTQASIQTEVYYPESVHQQPYFERKQELLDEPLNIDPVVLGVLSFLMSLSLKDGDRREVVLTTKESAAEAVR